MSQKRMNLAHVSSHTSRVTDGPPFGSGIADRVMDVVVDRLMEELEVAERSLRGFQKQLHRREEGACPRSCAMTAHPEVLVTDVARNRRASQTL